MRLLLHICCAPCSIACIQSLRDEGIQPHGFWYNPNIHPFTEYKARRNTLIDYAKSIDLPLDLVDRYGLRQFICGVYPDFDHRCAYCYRLRLEKTAQYAAEHGFDSFCTTLLISPYQNHELLRQIGQQAAVQYGVEFIYRDFRPLFRQGQQQARDLNLYMQKYCGCIFSEQDRYQKQIDKWQSKCCDNVPKS